MADVKKILVVDDHFEMLEFLRSMLEVSNQDYEVLAVPSAEEGLLELRRTHFDLLITDVRLPGMSGFDLVRRMRLFRPHVPTIMITAYSSREGQKEAADLEVYRYFRKPLDTDKVLTAVHGVLHGESQTPLPAEPVAGAEKAAVPAEIRKRLETLRADTGATGLLWVTVAGEILLKIGSHHQLDLTQLAKVMARNLSDSFLLAEQLENENPFTIQYHTGKSVELYSANVGRHHFVTHFFDIQSRRGRIGTIWVFTQQAIGDLVALLPVPSVDGKSGQKEESLPEPAWSGAVEFDDDTEKPPDVGTAVPATDETATGDSNDIVANEEGEESDLSFSDDAELEDLLGLDFNAPADSDDVEAFWDDALSEEESGSEHAGGLSLEEARRRGLIPTEFNDEEPSEE
jgi:CheY-like chemotaxis protein